MPCVFIILSQYLFRKYFHCSQQTYTCVSYSPGTFRTVQTIRRRRKKHFRFRHIGHFIADNVPNTWRRTQKRASSRICRGILFTKIPAKHVCFNTQGTSVRRYRYGFSDDGAAFGQKHQRNRHPSVMERTILFKLVRKNHSR